MFQIRQIAVKNHNLGAPKQIAALAATPGGHAALVLTNGYA